ncbi:MAG: FtsX-like permease family protein [Oscillospiraceae bacterium]|jgi:putative ABC transport system permease protein|nr:FtsX-like permease family protein [Oscillospiraceae bacterium]
MAFLENVLLALSGLKTSKMRSFLTMLGIIIGIGSVIGIMTVGDSVTGSVTSMMNDLGANNIEIDVSEIPDEFGNYTYDDIPEDSLLTDDMLEQYQELFKGRVRAIAVSRGIGGGQLTTPAGDQRVSVQGLNAGAMDTTNVDIVQGHFLNEREVKGAKNVIVISDRAAEKLFPKESPLGKEVRYARGNMVYTFYVVGIYHYEVSAMMQGMGADVTTSCYIPISVAQTILDETPGYYSWFQLRPEDGVDSRALMDQTTEYFNRYYRGNSKYEITAYSMESMMDQMTDMLGTIQLAISVIAAISLLVGGIGVMNIMLVSVTERTREIGTRKALGAPNGAIQMQFIVEAMIICLIGGIIGILLGLGLGYGGSALMGFPAKPSLNAVLLAVGFSMLIGLFFGYYPASKAAKLDPIEALRYE